jgi:hypothetical protein
MKNLRLLSFSMLLLFLFSTQGCHKDVISEQDTQPATSDLVENFVSDSYFAQANKYYKPSGENKIQSRTRVAQVDAVKDFFISHTSVVLHLVNTIGYPVWNESITSENNGDELLILPFSKLDTNRIDAVMLIHRPAGLDSMYFKTIRRNELHNLPNVSALSPDANEKYTELSREFATTMVLYFEYAIFTEVDCELANTTFGNPLSEPILESRGERCYYVEYVQEIQYWNRYAGGVMIYQESTIRYSWELVCDQIMDPGGFTGGGGSNWGYDPGGSTGSGNNENNNNAGPTLADCRQSNPELFAFLFNLEDLELKSACNNNKTIKINILSIEKKLCEEGKYNINNLWQEMENSIPDIEMLCIQYFGKDLNECEKKLVKNNKIAALKINYLANLAHKITREKFGSEANLWLDCGDAFRHGFFNALNASVLGKDLAKQFSDAHECDQSGNDALMDLHNNSIGHFIGELFPMNYYAVMKGYYEILADQVCMKLESGHLKVLEDVTNPNSNLIKSFHCKCN